jgi:SAM-dependent methyltransferase
MKSRFGVPGFIRHVADVGYDVLGLDLSASMIALARQRVPTGTFRVESLLTAEIPPSVAVTAIGECFNYLFDRRHSKKAIAKTFQRIHDALSPGGIFLLDVGEPGRAPGGSYKVHREGEDCAVLVSAEEDRRRLLTRRITTLRKVGALYRRGEEVHRRRLFPREEIVDALRHVGFRVSVLSAYGRLPFAPGHAGFLACKGSRPRSTRY